MGSDVYGLPSRETYPDSQNLRSDGAKIRSIIESPKIFGTFFVASPVFSAFSFGHLKLTIKQQRFLFSKDESEYL